MMLLEHAYEIAKDGNLTKEIEICKDIKKNLYENKFRKPKQASKQASKQVSLLIRD